MNGAGNCVVVWSQDVVVHIRSCSTASQTFGSDKIASAGVADDPEVGISDAGRAVAVWSRSANPANENRIEARVLTTTGTLATTKTIESAASGSPLFQPHVAVDGAGLAGIAYRAEDVADGGIIDIIKAATLRTSNHPTAPLPFSRDGHDTGEPVIAIDDAGASEVGWAVRAGGDSRIASRTLAANGTAGTRLTLSDLAASMDDPAIARSGPGAAAAAWHGNDETDDVVQGAFEPAP